MAEQLDSSADSCHRGLRRGAAPLAPTAAGLSMQKLADPDGLQTGPT